MTSVYFLVCCCLFVNVIQARVLPGWTEEETAVMTKKFEAIFVFYDTNNDGRVTMADLQVVLNNLEANSNIDADTKTKLQALLIETWTNVLGAGSADAALSKDQFVERSFDLLETGALIHAAIKIRTAVFYLMDINKDGMIYLAEFLKESNGIHDSSSAITAELTKAFGLIDADDDSKITACEYVSAFVVYVSDAKIGHDSFPLF